MEIHNYLTYHVPNLTPKENQHPFETVAFKLFSKRIYPVLGRGLK